MGSKVFFFITSDRLTVEREICVGYSKRFIL